LGFIALGDATVDYLYVEAEILPIPPVQKRVLAGDAEGCWSRPCRPGLRVGLP
jgi:hypothetical protein